MTARLRHALYWLAVLLGLPLILLAVAGKTLDELLLPLYGKLRSWTHQERYAPRVWLDE